MPLARQPARFIVLDTGRSIPLLTPPMTVGQRDPIFGPDPDIVFTDRQVGRRHAIIDEMEGYTIQDLNSRNKTTFLSWAYTFPSFMHRKHVILPCKELFLLMSASCSSTIPSLEAGVSGKIQEPSEPLRS